LITIHFSKRSIMANKTDKRIYTHSADILSAVRIRFYFPDYYIGKLTIKVKGA
jgi:hypothetical protein